MIRLFKGRLYGRTKSTVKDAKKLENKKITKQRSKVERLQTQKRERAELKSLQSEEKILKEQARMEHDTDKKAKMLQRKQTIQKRKDQLKTFIRKDSRLLPNYGNLKKRFFK